jgi:hypothetical protein
MPGDVGAGDGLHPEPVAGPDVAGLGAVGELDGAQRVPVQPAGGEFFLHDAQVLADAAEVRDRHSAEEAEQQPRPGTHGVVINDVAIKGRRQASYTDVMSRRAE